MAKNFDSPSRLSGRGRLRPEPRLLSILAIGWCANAGAVTAPGADFAADILPVLKQHCLTCHSTEKQKGDLDMERFSSLEEIRKHPAIWENVLEQISTGEMPPKKDSTLTDAEKQLLLGWVGETLEGIALANAGDPGPVVLRRLSNAEYTYTIRDLTGVETLDPAREFPIDGAAGEGFTNAGAALVMSPSLVTKYLDAAREIASHAVLLPEGIRFSPSTSQSDWTGEALAGIREFYSRYTVPGGGSAVNLQGIKFNTADGGVLPLAHYFSATLTERDALQSGTKTTSEVARTAGLNGKYLTTLWNALQDPAPSLLLDRVRAQWRAAEPGDEAALAADIAAWQQTLWRFTQVGHIGKRGGPEAWQMPVDPLAESHEIRLPLPAPGADGAVTLYLQTSDAGDGTEHDAAVWSNPRLTAPGRPDLPLRDIRSMAGGRDSAVDESSWGLDPQLSGPQPDRADVEASHLAVNAPSVLTVRIPADLAAGYEFAATTSLAAGAGPEGSVQMQVLTEKPGAAQGLAAGKIREEGGKGLWSDGEVPVASDAPILTKEGSPARRRMEAAFQDFRRLFPAALCYSKIVPVDEVVTLTLHYREDDPLRRLLLTDEEAAELDRRWAELRYVSQDALKLVDAFEQLWQFATQDADPSAFEPMREPIRERAENFRNELEATQPRHVEAVLALADKAWRRALTVTENQELRSLYQRLRTEEIPHEDAIRLMLSRVLVAPAFLYRGEKASPGLTATAVGDVELATRLSYFLWASAPDQELRQVTASGRLRQPEVLNAQIRRMLKDRKVRRLAAEFGCQWLHVRDVETLDEKSERHFPTFAAVRADMLEEAVRFFMDLFQQDRSVLSLLEADHTFVNGRLAQHYGFEIMGEDWQRLEGLRSKGRGGILGFASTLAKHSGASRTSPILRGNWLSEVVLGDRLPRPPKDVPLLPEEAPQGLTERQLIERHSSDAACAKCHQRIDPYGFALEGFDAIGRFRSEDAAGLPINTKSTLPDGRELDGLGGLRAYLTGPRRADFLHQFCRKLLGYALGRSVQLSDRPLLDTMLATLKTENYRVGSVIELIILSPQFQQLRGRDYPVQ